MIESKFIIEHNGKNSISKKNFTWLHGKAFNLNFIRSNNITFPRIRYNEDGFFLTFIRNLADERKIGSIDSITYIWRSNENSLTRNSEYVNHICNYYFVECMTKAFIDLAKQKKIKKSHFCPTLLNLYAYYQHYLLVQNEKYPIEALDKLLSELFSLPLIKEIMNKNPNSGTTLCSTKINKKVVYFKESYGAWLSKYMEVSND